MMEISTEVLRILVVAFDQHDISVPASDMINLLEDWHAQGLRWAMVEPGRATPPDVIEPMPMPERCSMSIQAWEDLRHRLYVVSPEIVFPASTWKIERLYREFCATPSASDSLMLVEATDDRSARILYNAYHTTTPIDADSFTWIGIGPIFYCSDKIPF
jgi:hypothetical protein